MLEILMSYFVPVLLQLCVMCVTTQNEVGISSVKPLYSIIHFIYKSAFMYGTDQVKVSRVEMVAKGEKS
jgi:hypothetical protein